MFRRRAATLALVLAALAGVASPIPAHASAATAESAVSATSAPSSTTSPCALVARGRVRGLTTRPAHVTFALASRYGSSVVRVTQCARTASGGYIAAWSTSGRAGRNGFAPPGAKREGDGRSPTGVYRLGPAFGSGDPGAHVGYLRLRPNSCWGSTVGSPRYNRYFRGACGRQDEAMYSYVRGAYRQGLVVGYNTTPIRPGRGSAIFFHASTRGATAGCVSVPLARITSAVRTARAGDVMVMGVAGAVLR